MEYVRGMLVWYLPLALIGPVGSAVNAGAPRRLKPSRGPSGSVLTVAASHCEMSLAYRLVGWSGSGEMGEVGTRPLWFSLPQA